MTNRASLILRLRRAADLWRDRKGAALVEFGLIAPVAAIIVLGIVNGACLMLAYNAMHTGVTAGAQYVMAGGQNLSTVQEISLSAWQGHSNSATVTATKACLCGSSAWDCATMCSDGKTIPQAYITVSAADTYNGPDGAHALSAQEQVRIR